MLGIDLTRLGTHLGRTSPLWGRVVVAQEKAALDGLGVADPVGLVVHERLPIPRDTPILVVWIVKPCHLGPCLALLREKVLTDCVREQWLDEDDILHALEAFVLLFVPVMDLPSPRDLTR